MNEGKIVFYNPWATFSSYVSCFCDMVVSCFQDTILIGQDMSDTMSGHVRDRHVNTGHFRLKGRVWLLRIALGATLVICSCTFNILCIFWSTNFLPSSDPFLVWEVHQSGSDNIMYHYKQCNNFQLCIIHCCLDAGQEKWNLFCLVKVLFELSDLSEPFL